MLNGRQDQQGGDNAINAQAGRDVIVQGVTYTEARQIAVDVYRANALELQGIAQRIASERAEHLVDQFLQKMQANGFERIEQAANPDFQHTLFEAQKAYARTGDEVTEAVLVDLLAARAGESSRSLRQIVLTEAVTAVSRLTPSQIDLVTLMFMLRHCTTNGLLHRQQILLPIAQTLSLTYALPETNTAYSYLVYAGVATNTVMQANLQTVLKHSYPGLLSKGFERSAVESLITAEPAIEQMLMPCDGDATRLQVRGQNEAAITAACNRLGISEHARFNLNRMQQSSVMPDDEIQAVLTPLGEPASRLIRLWNSTEIQQHSLTAVGQAVGHANASRRGLLVANLSVWIN
ncbi:hypothetical protein CI15_18965 [Paraburkholderia monticola]|uniref:Uncharacterized protein n=1 Tax=Paraburkholderia monticola TaxID=1399968 RepID=A0A149PN84_9BURK|nr:LPO_1073/Vpar_1526 family protein [Paraburkholderia monticola]KXU86520.1 hypothetical protein CI15_18965 [Paraburkholderia monticola]